MWAPHGSSGVLLLGRQGSLRRASGVLSSVSRSASTKPPPPPTPTPTPPTPTAIQPPSSQPSAVSGIPSLRPYQAACIEASLQAIRDGVTRQSVSLPVGSGKTVIFSSLIPLIPQPNPGAHKVLVLAHRTELLQQAAATIGRICPDLTVAIEQGAHTAGDADVVLGSVPTLGRSGSLRLSSLDPTEFKAIIVDEAHHATAATYRRVLDYFGCGSPGGDVHLWGCTATLRRHDGVSLGATFDQVSYHRTMLEMWDEGWLCKAKPHRIETGLDLSAVPVSSTTKEFSQPKLAEAVNDARRNALIVEAWVKLARDTGRRSTLVFCVDINHIRTLQAAFKAEGVAAYAVDGKTPADERAAVLEGFRDGAIPVLLNCAVRRARPQPPLPGQIAESVLCEWSSLNSFRSLADSKIGVYVCVLARPFYTTGIHRGD
jgi:ATP-dependent helicase IRC3